MNQRDQVAQLAKRDVDAANRLARRIPDVREQIQALGWVARYAPAERTVRIVEEACKSIEAAGDAYAGVMAMAWPLRALVETGQRDRVPGVLARVLPHVQRVEPVASRAEALFLLLNAVTPAGVEVAHPVIAGLMATGTKSDHWRVVRAIGDAALIVNAVDPQLAQQVAMAIPNANKRAAAMSRLANGESLAPRPFFW